MSSICINKLITLLFVLNKKFVSNKIHILCFAGHSQGAIMAVGTSKPTVAAGKDGFFTVKNKILVSKSSS